MNRLSRRDLLRVSGVTVSGALLAACAPTAPASQPAAEAGGEAAASGTTGNLQIWVQAYTPTESMEQSPNNPIPHNMIQVLADEYGASHPGSTVEVIRKPANVNDH